MASIHCKVQDSSIVVDQLLSKIRNQENGGECFFLGVVRDLNHGKKVVAVSYDAHVELSEKVLTEICQEAAGKWGKNLDFLVVHRTGKLEVGEASVIVGVGSVHRDECYEASRYVIEQLKLRAPIWKKEHYQDGETEWLKGHALCQHSH